MKAIRVHEFGAPGVMRLEDAVDVQAGLGQVVVRVRAAGVNPVDTYVRSGMYPNKPPLPYTPGSDAAGVVEQVGEGVGNVKAGDRVYVAGTASGAYAEMCVCQAAQVHPLPAHVTDAQGAGVFVPYATAYRALFQRARMQAGETVLVHGASGGVGIAAVQLARAGSLTVIGTGGSERGRQLVSEQGAHHVLDHTQSDYLEQVLKLTDGHGVDVILEMAAHINLGKDLGVLAKRGRVVIIGNRGTIEINPRDAMSREADVLAMSLFNATIDDMASIHQALVVGLENRTLQPVVGKQMPLADAAKAHEAVMQAGAYGKIVLLP